MSLTVKKNLKVKNIEACASTQRRTPSGFFFAEIIFSEFKSQILNFSKYSVIKTQIYTTNSTIINILKLTIQNMKITEN